MDRELRHRLGRLIRVLRENKSRLCFVRGFEFFQRERFARGEIRPAIPGAWLYLPENVGRAPDGTTAAFVITIVADVELSRRGKGETKGISKTPGYQLKITAVGPDAQDRAAALHGTGNFLIWSGRCAKW